MAADTTDGDCNGEVKNFDKVSDGIWRGAAPSQDAMESLAKKGVKTIIDLRMNGSASEKEKLTARKLGLRYVHVPLGYMKPSLERLRSIMRVAVNPLNQPVFIHCRQGADRTGTLCALYRRVFQGWTFDKAYDEMLSHHFKPFLLTLKNTVRDFDPGDFSESALKSAPDAFELKELTGSDAFDSDLEKRSIAEKEGEIDG